MFYFDSDRITFDRTDYEFTGFARVRGPECGDPESLTRQALALLPRGRAWQTHENGPAPGSVLYQFWRSIGELFAFFNGRACDLREEFFCDTAAETRDVWLTEYGLPDPCDPYPDLCAKVAAQGGARCEDYTAIAAGVGWDIDCIFDPDSCGDLAGNLLCGTDIVGGSSPPALIQIRVYPETSPAFAGVMEAGPFAGCFQAGFMLDCEPDISGLICVLSRVIHAHNTVEYFVSDPRTTMTDASLTADSGVNATGEYNA